MNTWKYNDHIRALAYGSPDDAVWAYVTKPYHQGTMATVHQVEEDIYHIEFFEAAEEAKAWCEKMLETA